MKLIVNVSGFCFALPVNVVDKVIETERIETTDDASFMDGTEISLFSGEDFFGIREKKNKTKTVAVMLALEHVKPIVLLFDSILGFVNEAGLNCFQKNEVLNLCGFDHISGFCLFRDKLLFIMNEFAVEKRLEELLWI